MTSSKRILVVEDDLAIQQALELVLKDEGYEVASVATGLDALALLPSFRPALIVLDLRMPVMDGETFVRAYREQPNATIPIIVVTASRNADDAAAELEVEAVLAKPFDLDELLSLVWRYVAPAGDA